MNPGLACRDLGFARAGRPVLEGITLNLAPGSFTGLIGANGAGKTTLLRLLLGLAEPAAGGVTLDGRPLNTLSRRAIASRIAYVPQSHVPSFPFTVREIVAMGRTPAIGWGAKLQAADLHAVDAALARVHMAGFADRSYADISGGERQAVLIARALAQDARILLLDEPTASLDLGQQTRLMRTLQTLTGEGYAVLASLHQPDLALRWCSDALVLHGGKALACGPVRDVLDERTLATVYHMAVRVIQAGGQRFVTT